MPVDEKKPYKMPHAYIGLQVHWVSGHDGTNPCLAFVQKIGDDRVDLLVIYPGYGNGVTKNGIKHAGHPIRTDYDMAQGFWEYVPAKDIDKVDRDRAALVQSEKPGSPPPAKK